MATTNLNGQGRVVSAYLPVSLANALQAKAQAEDRPVSQVIRRALREALHTEPR